ncbi:DUF924 family protein [Vulgatibacter incomptus]|uniref:Putative transmembrane protein n=1 Tax=Vulgatibacter incomptus TaxID=1391653 RepID=A0A0K1PAF1_9BACT|nr:DUF924 family protein [Vulgatibacter incomptus]AKU90495.1 Putative transmembrane protein [Vulgatibacter incomptus]
MERSEEILAHWFGEEPDDWAAPADRHPLWFGGGPQVDEDLRRRFATDVERARAGALDAWKATPRGRLALLILLDQLPRNLFRGTPEAFASDPAALALALEGIDRGDDRALRPIERTFAYLPLEHAEDRGIQARGVACFEALLAEAPERVRKTYESFLDYAVRHRVIVDRFGRFPHRNAILGRKSTPEEEAFLREPGSSF